MNLTETSHRNPCPHVFELTLGQLLKDRTVKHRRRNAVHENTLGGELLAERLCQTDDARFGRGIGGRIGVAFFARYRRNVHDAPIPAFEHVWDDSAATVKRA